MRFRMLGPLEFAGEGGWQGIGAAKWRSLLAVLLINSGRIVSIDQIVSELWGDRPPATAVSLVHGYVARLRGLLGDRAGRLLVTRTPGYLAQPGQEDVDTGRFTAAADRGRRALTAGDPRRAAEELAGALALWRGPALADVPATPLVEAEIARLHEQRLVAVETRLEADLANGRCAEVIAELGALTGEHPLREQLWAQLMLALAGAGRRAEALSVYARVRALLAEELGIDPGPALRRAHRVVLGAHEPAPSRRVPDRLPPDPPALVGRDEPLATALRWLASPSPSIAVTGPGGVGKTAFVTCLARQSRHLFPDGILHAALGRRTRAESVLARLLACAGILAADLPADPHRALWDLLAGQRKLIILDDVPDESLVRPLLPLPPGCGLLVASRRRLTGLDAVRPMPLGFLSDDAGVVLLRATVGDERAGGHGGQARAVVRACGGLPLAIKVAGARLLARPHWTVADLAGRLVDTSGRLDWLQLGDVGVRASVMDTVSGLTGDQRRLLRRLGLLEVREFAGWVAEALLGRESGPAELLLDDLVEAHLVEPAGHGLTGPRYAMHDLVRLAIIESTEDGDAAAVGRVLHGWLAWAAAADDRLAHWIGLDSEPVPMWRPRAGTVASAAGDPLRWFDEEHDALVRAVHQAAEAGYAQVAWALVQRMSAYLELRGRYDDWRAVLRRALGAADEAGDRPGQATMLGLLMRVEANRDEHRGSLRYAVLALDAYRALDTPPACAFAGSPSTTAALVAARRRSDALAVGVEASRLALALRLAAEPADYLGLFEEARDAFRAGGAPLLELWALNNVGLVYLRRRRFTDAERCLRRAQDIMRELGDLSTAGYAGGDLAGVVAAHGRADLAERLAGETLDHSRQAGDKWSEGRALVTMAGLHAARGDRAAARDTYQAALAVWRDLRVPRRVAQVEAALARMTSP